MLTERLNTRNYSLFEKLKSVDYFNTNNYFNWCDKCFTIYSTERVNFHLH